MLFISICSFWISLCGVTGMKFSRNVPFFWTDTAYFIDLIFTDDLRLHYLHYIPWPRWVGPWCLRPGLVTVQWPVSRWAHRHVVSPSPARLTGRKLFLCFSHNFTVTDNIIGISHSRESDSPLGDHLNSSGGLISWTLQGTCPHDHPSAESQRVVIRDVASPRLSQHAQILINDQEMIIYQPSAHTLTRREIETVHEINEETNLVKWEVI